ncbi:MAG TPA: ATP-binding cassette domain-containing protein [Candidatus Binatia bacterium]|jgi:phospholipid/cholesterol/gamma-HCH transport system ATP-binding protein|nr:ATP-binding cassette domain-containing protein [Candidatus Binatia bacterium]
MSGVAVELAGVHKQYGGQLVLDGVDLTVPAGELLAVVGQSGQGKSVLLRQIVGLERVEAGTITVGGLPVQRYLAMPPEEKPFRIAMVFQNAALLASLTVGENVALRLEEHAVASRETIRATVARALEQVELAGSEDKMPGELSGGMRKRVAIARALAVDPELILYDEPTADLDPLLTEQIGALIARIRATRGSTQIVVTHNLALARAIADRIAVLASGRIVELLTPDALMASRHPLTREFLRASGMGM